MTTTKTRISKIVFVVLFCFMLCISLFAGCNIIGEDMSKYYNASVVTLTYKDTGEKIDITKRELILAFNTTGAQYYQQSNDPQYAYDQTAKLLVYRKLTVKDAEKLAKEKEENHGETLTKKQKTYLFEMTYQTAKDYIVDYYNEMNGINDEEEESQDGVITQTMFTPSAKYVDGKIVLEGTVEDEVKNHVYFSDLTTGRDVTKQEDMDVLYKLVSDYVADNEQYIKAYSKYLADVKNSEKGMNLSESSDSVFKRELRRIYDSLYENFMIRQYQYAHQEKNSSVTITSMLEKYQNDLANDYNKYVVEGADYDNDVLNGVESVNYFKLNGANYFYVSHLLAKFTPNQEARYKLYQGIIDGKNYDSDETSQEDNSLDEEQARILMEDLYSEVAFNVRDKVKNEDGTIDWVDNGKTKLAKDVASELALALKTCGDDEYKKAEMFTNEFFYKYNQDDGMFSSERNYVIGITNGGEVKSSMVEPFTDAAISLYDGGKGKIGDIYMPDESKIETALVRTQFGIHIVVYMGRVKNLVEVVNPEMQLPEEVLEILSSKEARLKAGESKTVFDELFESLSSNQSTIFETMNLKDLTNAVNIEYHPDEYKDLVDKLKK